MNFNTIIHHLVATKFGWNESSVSSMGEEFMVISEKGEILTEKDFTKSEIADAKKDLENSLLLEQQKIETQKAALLEKLGITQDEAKLLLS